MYIEDACLSTTKRYFPNKIFRAKFKSEIAIEKYSKCENVCLISRRCDTNVHVSRWLLFFCINLLYIPIFSMYIMCFFFFLSPETISAHIDRAQNSIPSNFREPACCTRFARNRSPVDRSELVPDDKSINSWNLLKHDQLIRPVNDLSRQCAQCACSCFHDRYVQRLLFALPFSLLAH